MLTTLLSLALLATPGPDNPCEPSENRDLRACAEYIAQKYIIADGHIDVPYRMTERVEDIADSTVGGDFDYPRALSGGLNAPFMSIYIPASFQETPGAAAEHAHGLIDMVEGFVQQDPDKFQIAYRASDLAAHQAAGVISLPMGMENGAPIENDLSQVAAFHERGIRYITLTHSRDNTIGDASYDTTRTWGGLSPFGFEVVDEMNRVGIMIDISHVTDETAYDVLERSLAPVIASHSSLRHYTPGWERNMPDEMLPRLAENGGVIMINFGSSFLRSGYQAEGTRIQLRINQFLSQRNLEPTSDEGFAFFAEQRRANPIGTLSDVADHIDRAVELAGIDHVGLGSDFDGVFALPSGLQDISEYPNLIEELLRRGYSEEDIAKILGGNLIRVWTEVERVAADLSGE